MSREHFDDDCPSCKPILLDIQTSQPLPDDNPIMVVVLAIWKAATPGERKAFHDICCMNPHDTQAQLLAKRLTDRMADAARAYGSAQKAS